MNLTQKISQMTPKGADLDATDLIEVSTIVGGSYVTKSITGQELIDAIPLPPTGLTVGTTPISSGTIGRVLFQGTGNVLQQSSSLFWDSTNNRLGIGTSTPSYQLHVVGSAGFDNGASGDSITLLNGGFIQSGLIRFRGFSTNFILQDNSYNTKFAISTAGNLSYFNTGGNVAINTTTDAGFRLDVNGTARVSGNAHFGTGVAVTVGTDQVISMRSSTTTARFYLQNSGTGTNSLSGVSFDLSNSIFEITNRQASGTTAFITNGAERMRVASTGNVLIGTTTDAGFRLDVNGTARVANSLDINNNNGIAIARVNANLTVASGGASPFSIIDFKAPPAINGTVGLPSGRIVSGFDNTVYAGTRVTIQNATGPSTYVDVLSVYGTSVGIGILNPSSSALLDLTSTTKGFLPPRMTTTQKNAIASPATGLQVFDTTLNQMSYYNGTTWTNI